MICSTLLTRIENSHEEAKMNGEGNSSNATARFSWESQYDRATGLKDLRFQPGMKDWIKIGHTYQKIMFLFVFRVQKATQSHGK